LHISVQESIVTML
nr:immunoglobulin heavy chain junction region [Mus musculus]